MKRVLLPIFAATLIGAAAASAQVESFGLRMIVVQTESEARDILSRLQAGEPFEQLARKRSTDRSARAGGYLGTVSISELKRELQDALKGLSPGQVSPITKVGAEYLLLQLLKDEGAERIAVIDAATTGDAARLKSLLDAGAGANTKLDDGSSVLMAAAYLGHLEVVRILLNAGADRNAALEDGSTVLMKAALAGNGGIIRVLVDAGANVNSRARNGLTALMQAAFAGHADIATILLSAGADVNATLDNGSTALMAAALGGHADIVSILVDAGADVHAKAKTGSTALTEAVYKGHLDAAQILLRAGADVNAKLTNGSTALMAAALAGRVEIVRALLDAGADMRARDQRGWTALTHAAASTNSESVKVLLARDADISAKEAGVILGGTYINEFYSTREARLLDLATAELRKSLAAEPDNLAALEWMAAVEFLHWDEHPSIQQYRSVNRLLKKCADLDPKEPDRHYWIAATDWIFASRGKGASPAESVDVIDEGIDHAQKVIELDPLSAEAMEYLDLLYRQKAERVAQVTERDRLLKIADRSRQDARQIRDGRAGRPSRPDDQFSRPAPPPPP